MAKKTEVIATHPVFPAAPDKRNVYSESHLANFSSSPCADL
ncbi:MAG TPA: hypothetical protein VLZ30_05080 [Verrucomicrobiae bacterium]|nr:hypothetical protein [Verrucomicrobiae bacterium]